MTRDIFTEPSGFDFETLRNLGPLRPLAGTWEGRGLDIHPVADGTMSEAFQERIVFAAIDPQTNGPQLFYGLRYHVHINNDERLTFHEQVGYWLWEPATGTILQTVAIPRGLVALARGVASPDARTFSVKAILGSPTAGIISAPFLDQNFKTTEYALTITVMDDSFTYEQEAVLEIAGRPEPFRHLDRNTLRRVAAAVANPAVTRALGNVTDGRPGPASGMKD